MDELENDKIIYWVIFFVALILIAVLGHHYVFSYKNDKENKEEDKIVEEKVNVNEYIGVWQFYASEKLPLQELCINVIDGSTITFDLFVKDIVYFESQTANLVDNSATFNITDREGEESLSGKIIFKNDKVFLSITSSTLDNFRTGTIEFSEKSDESLLD